MGRVTSLLERVHTYRGIVKALAMLQEIFMSSILAHRLAMHAFADH